MDLPSKPYGIHQFADNGWRIKLDIRARPKQSTRFARGFAYQPKKVRDNENYLKWIFNDVWKNPPIEGPVRININFFFKRFKKSKNKQHAFFHTVVPDLDNCVKAIKDALKKIVFLDDGQVCEMDLSKYWDTEDSIVIEIVDLDNCEKQ